MQMCTALTIRNMDCVSKCIRLLGSLIQHSDKHNTHAQCDVCDLEGAVARTNVLELMDKLLKHCLDTWHVIWDRCWKL